MINRKKSMILEHIICPECKKENVDIGIKLKEYVGLLNFEVGFTALGLQVWCNKHKRNVCHVNFNKNIITTEMDINVTSRLN